MKKNKERTAHFFSFKRKNLCIPYGVFLILFIVIPIFIIIYYAFSNEQGIPSAEAMISFFTTWSKVSVLFTSLFIALQTTIICLLIGFPLCYFLADKKVNKNVVLVTLFIAPTWINFVLRTLATRELLTWMGINGGNTPYLATLIGMVQNYLPFVILPLYTTMIKLDRSQMEAARDLGASPAQVFFKNTIPQSIPGIISACMMTFMPTMSSYVITDVFSEGKITIFGNFIYLDFNNNLWNDGAFMAVIMLIIIVISLFFTRDKKKGKVGSAQW